MKIARLLERENGRMGESRNAIVNEDRKERNKRTTKEQSRENSIIRTMDLQINSRQEKKEQVSVCRRDSRGMFLVGNKTKRRHSEEEVPLKRKQRGAIV